MEKDFFENYVGQSDGQIELIQQRYVFGLNQIEMIYSKNEQISNIQWLDIGSNMGYGVSAISDHVNIIASDIDRRYLESNNESLISKVNLDSLNLPFKSNSFDVISYFETIEHIPLEQVRPTLLEIHRVLKKDGMLLISTPNRIANGKVKMSPDHKQEFSPEELSFILKMNGFNIMNKYGQNFIKKGNILHEIFLEMRENEFIRKLFYYFPPSFVRKVRDCSINAFGSGEVRKREDNELERIIYFVCKKQSVY